MVSKMGKNIRSSLRIILTSASNNVASKNCTLPNLASTTPLETTHETTVRTAQNTPNSWTNSMVIECNSLAFYSKSKRNTSNPPDSTNILLKHEGTLQRESIPNTTQATWFDIHIEKGEKKMHHRHAMKNNSKQNETG